MKKPFVKIIQYIAFLALGLALLYLAFRKVDFREMLHIISGAKYKWIALSLFFSFLALISRARRWSLLIEPLGKRPGLWNTYNAMMFGYLANYALPRMGEVTKCIALNRKSGIKVDALIGTVVVERAIDLLSAFIVLIFLLIARFEKFGAFFRDELFKKDNLVDKSESLLSSYLIPALILAAIGIILLILIIVYWKRIREISVVQKILEILRSFSKGIRTIFRMDRKWEFLAHTIFIWLCYALMTWVVVFALPEITGEFKFADGVFLLVVGTVGMAMPVQAGIGAFHYFVSRGLVMVYGLGETEGQAFATLQHTSQTLLVFLLGSLSAIFLFTKFGNKNKKDASVT